MSQMEKYYVVISMEERDELFATIDAMSLDEANAIFKIRYQEDIERFGEVTFYIFSEKGKLEFDKNNRLIFPKVELNSIHKW